MASRKTRLLPFRWLSFFHGGFTDSAVSIEKVPTEELVWTYGIPNEWNGIIVVRGHALVEQIEIKDFDININPDVVSVAI